MGNIDASYKQMWQAIGKLSPNIVGGQLVSDWIKWIIT